MCPRRLQPARHTVVSLAHNASASMSTRCAHERKSSEVSEGQTGISTMPPQSIKPRTVSFVQKASAAISMRLLHFHPCNFRSSGNFSNATGPSHSCIMRHLSIAQGGGAVLQRSRRSFSSTGQDFRMETQASRLYNPNFTNVGCPLSTSSVVVGPMIVMLPTHGARTSADSPAPFSISSLRPRNLYRDELNRPHNSKSDTVNPSSVIRKPLVLQSARQLDSRQNAVLYPTLHIKYCNKSPDKLSICIYFAFGVG